MKLALLDNGDRGTGARLNSTELICLLGCFGFFGSKSKCCHINRYRIK